MTTKIEHEQRVLADLSNYLTHGTALEDKTAVAMPVAAMNALLGVVERTNSHTMMGLQDELKEAAHIMLEWNAKEGNRSNISLKSGCDLFLKYSPRTFLELDDFDACRAAILERGQRFAGISACGEFHANMMLPPAEAFWDGTNRGPAAPDEKVKGIASLASTSTSLQETKMAKSSWYRCAACCVKDATRFCVLRAVFFASGMCADSAYDELTTSGTPWSRISSVM